MANVPTPPHQINKDQGGQAAIMFGMSLQEQTKRAYAGAPLVQEALTPVYPEIVTPPVTPLPVKLTPQLPSITTSNASPGGLCESRLEMAVVKDSPGQVLENGGGGWLCALGRWVDGNPVLALGVVVGAWVLGKRTGKRGA